MFSHPGHAHLQTDPYSAAGSLHCFQSSPQVSQTLWKKNEQKINVQNSFGASFGYEQVRREVYGRCGGEELPFQPGLSDQHGFMAGPEPSFSIKKELMCGGLGAMRSGAPIFTSEKISKSFPLKLNVNSNHLY